MEAIVWQQQIVSDVKKLFNKNFISHLKKKKKKA